MIHRPHSLLPLWRAVVARTSSSLPVQAEITVALVASASGIAHEARRSVAGGYAIAAGPQRNVGRTE